MYNHIIHAKNTKSSMKSIQVSATEIQSTLTPTPEPVKKHVDEENLVRYSKKVVSGIKELLPHLSMLITLNCSKCSAILMIKHSNKFLIADKDNQS